MKPRAFVMLGLAVILAGVSVALARTWLHSRLKPDPAAQAPGVATTRIVVAAAPLRYGDEIRREHLRLAEWPATAVPDGAFGAPEQVLGEASAGPRVALRAIEANEPILAAKITGLGGRASLSTLIAPGMRATTIRVNDVNGVAGFVLPGDRVDVLLTRDQPGDRRGANPITDILLQNMKVLGVDQDAGEGRERAGVARAVTLEVTSIQAQKLTLAQRLGTLSLALRHVNTADAERPRTITVRDLRVGKAEVARPATLPGKDGAGPQSLVRQILAKTVRAKLSPVRVYRGLEASDYEVMPEVSAVEAQVRAAPPPARPSEATPRRRVPNERAPAPGPGPAMLAPPFGPIDLLKSGGGAGGGD